MKSLLSALSIPPLLIGVLCSGLANAETQALSQEQRIKQGEYISRAGDCAACHTSIGGKAFAGGLGMQSPVGAIYSTNITPDKKTGIGEYSYEEFATAVRHGVAKDGHRLYPAMPFPSFAKINDEDLQNLYQYFMHGVEPVEQANKEGGIPWPLNMRWPLAFWTGLFTEEGIYQAVSNQDEQWNRGAYLVQGLGHCGSCHSPRGLGFQEKALSEQESGYLTGGTLEGWHAPNLTGDKDTGLGNWSVEELATFLHKGHNEKTAAFGSMVSVIEDSTQYLNQQDINAIAVYLKSLAASGAAKASIDPASDSTAVDLAVGKTDKIGAQVYLDSCAACHRTDGKGYQNTFPQLAQNSAILSEDPSSVISIILQGSKVPTTYTAPTGLTMPDFGWRLTDQEVANVATFIRQSWGNQAPTVKADDVKKIRAIK